MKLEKILNEQERDKVGRFLEDETLVNAIGKILLLGIYENGVIKPGEEYDATTNFALGLAFRGKEKSNEELGADLRACAEGIRLLESAFQQLDSFRIKAPKVEKPNINKAR